LTENIYESSANDGPNSPGWVVLPGAEVASIPVAKPGMCTKCIAEQHIAGVPMHLRAEWALAFLTH